MADELEIYGEEINIDGEKSSGGSKSSGSGVPNGDNPQDGNNDDGKPEESDSDNKDENNKEGDGEGEGEGDAEGNGKENGDSDKKSEQPKDGDSDKKSDEKSDSENNKDDEESDNGKDESQENEGKDEKKFTKCLVVKRCGYKGYYAEVLKYFPDTDYYDVSVHIDSGVVTSFERQEVVFEGDVVDYARNEGESPVYFGTIMEFPEGYNRFDDVKIVNKEDGYSHEVMGMFIDRLHKQEPDEPEKNEEGRLLCKSVSFLANLAGVNNAIKISRCVFPKSINKIWDSLYMNTFPEIDKDSSDESFYVTDFALLKQEMDIDDEEEYKIIDEKILKYIILAVKNNPKYFQDNWENYFFYDKCADIFISAIASNEKSISGYINVAAISDDEVLVSNADYTTIGTVKINEDTVTLSNKYLPDLLKMLLINENKWKLGFPQDMMDKMKSYTDLVHSSLFQ